MSIPVKLYSAAESKAALSFNQTHKKDGARVKQQIISSRTGEVVPREDITLAPTAEPEHKVIDIMEALKASLAAGAARRLAQAADKKPAAKSKTAAK